MLFWVKFVSSDGARLYKTDAVGTTVHGVSNWYGTNATLVTSTCCRVKQVFVSDCLQKRSLYAAGKWFPKFTDLSKSVLSSHTLFTASMDSKHLCPIFTYRPGYAVTKSYTVHLFCVYPSLPFGGRASSRLGRRFVCKEILGSTLGQSGVKYPLSTAQLSSRSRSLRHSSSLHCQLDELVAMFPYAGAERFTSFPWIQDSILLIV